MSDITVGSVAVDIVPDTRGFAEKLKAKVKGITADIGITADTGKLRAELDDVTRDRMAKIVVTADTAAASAQIDEAARTRTAKINVESRGLPQVSNLLASVALLGPALVPITAAVVGLGLALGAPLAIAAGGATVFGFIAGAAVKKTDAQKKQIDKLAKSVTSAKAALAAAQSSAGTSAANSLATAHASAAASIKAAQQSAAAATTAAGQRAAQARIQAAQATLAVRTAAVQRSSSASVARAQAKVTAAVTAYNAAVKGLTPAQQKFLDSRAKLKDSFQGLIESVGPKILGPVSKALDLLAGLLPSLTPLISAASGAFDQLLGGIGDAAKSPGFKSFIDAFAKQLGPDLISLGTIGGNVFKGLSGLVLTLGGQLGGGILGSLENLSGKFATFGQNAGSNAGFQKFIAYVRDVGPKVATTVGHLAGAIGHVASALAPIGALSLAGLDEFAKLVETIPTPVLTALAGAVITLIAAFKGYQVFQAAADGLSALSGGLRGAGRGGGKGVFATAAGKAAGVVDVFVTNPGFGGGAGGGIVTDVEAAAAGAAATAKGLLGKVGPKLGDIGAKGAGIGKFGRFAVSGFTIGDAGNEVGNAPSTASIRSQLENQRLKNQFDGAEKVAQATRDQGTAQADLNVLLRAGQAHTAAYTAQLKTLPKAVRTQVQTPGAIQSYDDVRNLKHQYDLTPKQVKTLVRLEGIPAAKSGLLDLRNLLASIRQENIHVNVTKNTNAALADATVNNPRRHRARGGPVSAGTPYLVGEIGPDVFVPKVPGTIVAHSSGAMSEPAGGPTFVFNGDIRPNDYNDLMRQLQQRAQRAAIGGRV